MYRQYLKSSLDSTELKEINRNTPEGVKYCNGICQDYRDKSTFSGQKVYCNSCRNLMNMAEKQIETRRLAQERERIQNILNKQIISNIEYGSLLLEYQNLYKGIEDGTITEGQRYRNQYNQYKRK